MRYTLDAVIWDSTTPFKWNGRVSQELLERFFVSGKDNWQVKDSLRESLAF
ncbi:MAG: hypothetical protein KKB51_09530 [Candidatus Riflebacteria bacterium]|nr:hypothetical protein [Candidatus Riflebacteria bacterium]